MATVKPLGIALGITLIHTDGQNVKIKREFLFPLHVYVKGPRKSTRVRVTGETSLLGESSIPITRALMDMFFDVGYFHATASLMLIWFR